MGLIILIVVLLAVAGVFPGNPYGYQHDYGYGPSGIGGIILLIIIVLLLTGRL